MRENPLWYCPFYQKTVRKGDRRSICCEGGSRVVFEDFAAYDGFARRFCRAEGCGGCGIARSLYERWGVESDGR